MATKKEKKITARTKLGEIWEKHPRAAKLLAEKYQLHCFGCVLASLETLKQGLLAHGLSPKEIKKALEEVNRFYS